MLSINTNSQSLTMQRLLASSHRDQTIALQRLSSGKRVNSAADDAAGLAISNRMTTRFQGLNQAIRNANDSISFAQVADGALDEISSSLFRLKELGVQAANGSHNESDLEAIQTEINEIKQHINKVGADTEYNGAGLFSTDATASGLDANEEAVLRSLHSNWLSVAEDRIEEYFGLSGVGDAISIDMTTIDGAGGTAARVIGTLPGGGDGTLEDMVVEIDMDDFDPPNLPNGGSAPFYNDRIIAHEMVHAVMGSTVNNDSTDMPTWFKEGAAEFIHGADERVATDLAAAGGNANTIVTAIGAGTSGSWGGNSIDYSTAFVAVRYLHDKIKEAGGDGIKDLMQYLAADTSRTLDNGIAATTNFANTAAFIADYTSNGEAYLNAMDLSNEDTGAIGGYDADAGSVFTAESIIDNSAGGYEEDPLDGFVTTFEQSLLNSTGGYSMTFQVGANTNETIVMRLGAVSAEALNVADVDVTRDPHEAIYFADVALEYVSEQRANLGAIQNRMESSIANMSMMSETTAASRQRILDTDYAQETSRLTRTQVLQSAATSMLAQANLSQQDTVSMLLG